MSVAGSARIPLVDLGAQYQTIRDEVMPADRGRDAAQRLHPRTVRRGLRARDGRVRPCQTLRRVRQRHRGDLRGAQGARRQARRRGHHRRQHVHRDGRGDRVDAAPAGARRRRPGRPPDRPGGRRGGRDRADGRDRAGPPVRAAGPDAGAAADRGPARPVHRRGRGAGARRLRGRAAGRDAQPGCHLQLLPRQEPGRLRRRRRRDHRRPGPGAADPADQRPRARRPVRARRRRVRQPAGRPPGRDPLGEAPAPGRVDRAASRGSRPATTRCWPTCPACARSARARTPSPSTTCT